MAHQQPKSAAHAAYNYTLEHEVAALVQELARQEGEQLDLQALTPSNYLTRLIKREAAEKLDEESRARARAVHEKKLKRRLEEGAEDPATIEPGRRRRRKAAEPLVS